MSNAISLTDEKEPVVTEEVVEDAPIEVLEKEEWHCQDEPEDEPEEDYYVDDPADDASIEEMPEMQLPVVGEFELVSYESFEKLYKDTWIELQKQQSNTDNSEPIGYKEEDIQKSAKALYDNIELPKRPNYVTPLYYFNTNGEIKLAPGETVLIYTGIKVSIAFGWALLIAPNSSLGERFRIQMDDTVKIISPEYYNNEANEGQIIIRLTNDNKNGYTCVIPDKYPFATGMFIPYGITITDAKELNTPDEEDENVAEEDVKPEE